MNKDIIQRREKVLISNKGVSVNALDGVWDSTDDFEEFCESVLSAGYDLNGMTINVAEGNDVVKYTYKKYGGTTGTWVKNDDRVSVIRFGGVIAQTMAAAPTHSDTFCTSDALYWNTTISAFVVKVGTKYYNTCKNIEEFCNTNRKPLDNAVYVTGSTIYIGANGKLVMPSSVNGVTQEEMDAAISSAIASYNENAVKTISVRTVNDKKSIALLNSAGSVVSSVSIDELGLTPIITTLDAPSIKVNKNVCNIVSNVTGASIYWSYKTDPTVSIENLYTEPFNVEYEADDTADIRAIAVLNNVKSQVAVLIAEKYVVVNKPTITQEDNTITITCSSANSSIKYTTDGSVPSETNGTVYNGTVTLSADCTVKAVAFVNTDKSDVAEFAFEYTAPVVDPVVTSPFVVATWNVGRWSLGKSYYPSISVSNNTSAANYYTKIATKVKGVLAKIDPTSTLPAVLGTQETSVYVDAQQSKKTSDYFFDDFTHKIEPLGQNSTTYGHYRNCLYMKNMTAVTDGQAVLTAKDVEDSKQGYYTISVATIGGKQVAFVSTHFDPTSSVAGTANRKAISQKIQTDLQSYQYAVIFADFNVREFALMPSTPFDYLRDGTKHENDAHNPCGFATAGYSCASGGKGTVTLITDTSTTPYSTAQVLINGSGTNFYKVDNILVKGLTISKVGKINVSDDTNDVTDNTKLSDHDIIYCTLEFNS